MRIVKTILAWIVGLLLLAFVFAMDDSYQVRRHETKPFPWEQFMNK